MAVAVNVDNFVRAETARMFDGGMLKTGGINRFHHERLPVPIDAQTVIRMNRDTLYSSALVNITEGATLTIPDPAGRYVSLMGVNEDHYVNDVFHEGGSYELTMDMFESPFVALVMRTFLNPDEPEDVAAVHAFQDGVQVEARSHQPYGHPEYDEKTRKVTFDALVSLAGGTPDASRMFGTSQDVDPVHHLIGTAAAWGGLPKEEAYYIVDTEPRPAGHYTFILRNVPVDGFWSVTIYNRDGFLEANPYDSYSLNNVTAVPDSDGTVTLNLAPANEGLNNHLYVMEGWNYTLRLYRPRQSILDGTWTIPRPEPVK